MGFECPNLWSLRHAKTRKRTAGKPRVSRFLVYSSVAQLEERTAHNREVAGSCPARGTFCGVEKQLSRQPHKLEIVGATPTSATYGTGTMCDLGKDRSSLFHIWRGGEEANASVCKTDIHQFKSGSRLEKISECDSSLIQ